MSDPCQDQAALFPAPAVLKASESVLHASQLWTDIFTVAAYGMAALCVFGGIRRGMEKKSGRSAAWGVARQLGIFVFFAGTCYALESYAHFRTMYYAYAPEFRDQLPRLPLDRWLGKAPLGGKLFGRQNVCTTLVASYALAIPMAVVLFEASLSYCAMWTARFLKAKIWTQSLLAGVVLVNVDMMLDPIVSQAHDCVHPEQVLPDSHRAGIGLWHWFAPVHAQDLCPPPAVDTAGNLLAPGHNILSTWFGVPLFNFVAWWTAPVVLVSAVIFVSRGVVPWSKRLWRLFERLWRPGAPPQGRGPTPGKDAGVLTGLVLAIVTVVLVSPNLDPTEASQWVLTIGCVALSLCFFLGQFGHFDTTKDFDATLTGPPAAALLVPAIAAVATGQALNEASLMPVVAVSFALGLWLAWLPFRKALKRIARAIGQLDRFVRFHYFGFTAMLIMFGGALSQRNPTCVLVGGLLAVAVCFHVYSYVLNDIVDLDVDAKVASRKNDPLVSGRVKVHTAAGLVGVAVFAAVAATLFLVGANSQGKRYCYWSFAALGFAFAFMTVYNVWGKKCPVPVFTDAVEGIAWGLLAPFGALATADAATFYSGWRGVVALGFCGGLFILLINGIHGGLRDAANDRANGKHTTALWLGARPEEGTGGVTSNSEIIVFAFAVHTALFAVLLAFVTWDPPGFAVSHGALVFFIVVLCVVNSWILWQVVRPESAHRGTWISTHVFTLLLPPLLVFLCDEQIDATFKWGVALTFFVPLVVRQPVLEALIEGVYERKWDRMRGAYRCAADVVYARSSGPVEPREGRAERPGPFRSLTGGAKRDRS
jgi:4-hydroxybenzoate polyprenyltransferase